MRREICILGLLVGAALPAQAQETVNRAEECFAELSAVTSLRSIYENQGALDETIPALARYAEAQGYAILSARQAVEEGAFSLNDAGNDFAAEDKERVMALMTDKLNTLVVIAEGGVGLQVMLAHSFIDACKADLGLE